MQQMNYHHPERGRPSDRPSPPFTVQQINRDTGIRVAHKTHIECVLRKR